MINIKPHSYPILVTGSHSLIFSGLKNQKSRPEKKINSCGPVTRIRHSCGLNILLFEIFSKCLQSLKGEVSYLDRDSHLTQLNIDTETQSILLFRHNLVVSSSSKTFNTKLIKQKHMNSVGGSKFPNATINGGFCSLFIRRNDGRIQLLFISELSCDFSEVEERTVQETPKGK
jgi:hypothetical protein